MKRIIVLLNKPSGNNEYACDGSGCDLCEARFKCFTFARGVLIVDWDEIKTKKSPVAFLRGSTHSKIYVKGSKKFDAVKAEIW